MRRVRLGDVVRFYSGGTPSKSKSEWWSGEVPWFSAKGIKSHRLTDSVDHISSDVFEQTSLRRVPAGTVVLVVRGMILAHTVPISVLDVSGAINQDLKALIPLEDLDPTYLASMLRAQHDAILARVSTAAHGTKKIDARVLEDVGIPFPPLEEQRRIAATLDQADAIRTKRHQVLTHLGALKGARFDECLRAASGTALLGDIADIQSGITKGRRTSEETHATPYLAVANVQAGRLDLTHVKSIEATEAERLKYRLKDGDLLLTEGGDPDKLGRGTVWRNEVDGCLHQNHVFRVRIQDTAFIASDVLSAHLASWEARSYFLRSAKQTTGIASINKTQLSRLPVPVLGPEVQERMLREGAAITAAQARVREGLVMDDELFVSLQSRAFRGEL